MSETIQEISGPLLKAVTAPEHSPLFKKISEQLERDNKGLEGEFLKIKLGDPETKVTVETPPNGEKRVKFKYVIDSNPDPQDGRLYFIDTFVFGRDGKYKKEEFTRIFDYPRNTELSNKLKKWGDTYVALGDPPISAQGNFAERVVRRLFSPNTPDLEKVTPGKENVPSSPSLPVINSDSDVSESPNGKGKDHFPQSSETGKEKEEFYNGTPGLGGGFRLWAGWTGIFGNEKDGDKSGKMHAFGPGLSIEIFGEEEMLFWGLDTSVSIKFASIEKTQTNNPKIEDNGYLGTILSLRPKLGFGDDSGGFYIFPFSIDPYFSNLFSKSVFSYQAGLGGYFGDRVFFFEGGRSWISQSDDPFFQECEVWDVRIGINPMHFFKGEETRRASVKPDEPWPKTKLTKPFLHPQPEKTPRKPPAVEVKKEGNVEKIVVNQKIYFDYNDSIIKPESYRVLDAIVEILIKHPEIKKIEIQGHADDRGTEDYNLNLSQKRAEAVAVYLEGKSDLPAHLIARGYGKTRPLVEGNSEEAREQNRRVEFIILEKQEK